MIPCGRRQGFLDARVRSRAGQRVERGGDLLAKRRQGAAHGPHHYHGTSTSCQGLAEQNPQAQHGYSRDKRFDCKQVSIALRVTRGGLPLGYEVFAGNRNDMMTLEDIVEAMDPTHGRFYRGND